MNELCSDTVSSGLPCSLSLACEFLCFDRIVFNCTSHHSNNQQCRSSVQWCGKNTKSTIMSHCTVMIVIFAVEKWQSKTILFV